MEPLRSVDEIVDRYSVENSSFKSKLYIGLGSMFVVFAIAGIWIRAGPRYHGPFLQPSYSPYPALDCSGGA